MAYAERTKGKLTGRWCADVSYKHKDGMTQRWHKAFVSKGEAEGFEAYVRATGQPPANSVAAPTQSFAAAAERFKSRNQAWLDAHDGKTNAQRLQFGVDFLGKDDVAHIRKQRLEAYVDHLRKHAGRAGLPPANRTINYYLDAVSKVLRDCFEHEEIPSMPKVPREKNSGKARGVLTWNQENAICARITLPNVAFCIRVLAATGMRRGELMAIKPEWIDTPEQDENCGIMLPEEHTKTNAARWIPMPRAAASKLRAIIAAGKLPDAAQLYAAFKRAAETLGDGSDLTIHCLRHTTVTRLLAAGVEGLDVAALVGHTIPGVPKMTLRYYHPDKAHLASVAKKVQNGLGEMAPERSVIQFLDAKSA